MNRFEKLLKEKEFVFLDGALGTMLQRKGFDLGKVPEALNITNPEGVIGIHREYIEAGSDIIYSCSFGVNKHKLKGTDYTVEQLITAAIKNAKEAAKGTDALVALDIGPSGMMLEPNGYVTFEEAYEMFALQIKAGAQAGADLIAIETMTDLYETKAAVLAAKETCDLPIICTMTFEENQRTFTGTALSSMALTLEGLGVDAIGINCSLGPKEFLPLIEELSKWTTLPLVAKSNAGLPDPATGKYSITPEEFAKTVMEFVPHGIKLVGGCCGTDPRFIKALVDAFDGLKYKKQNPKIDSAVCTAEKTVVLDQPRIIGERINPTGKKKLKEAYKNDDMDYVLAQAVDQIKDGAEILDVNTGLPGIDEALMMKKVVKVLQGASDAPLQIDSNKPEVIEAGLRIYCGKAIVNSVTGEEKSLNAIIPIAKKYGAAIVGLTLDEDGIPTSVEKRLEIAERIMNRALEAGIPKRDIYIDCLTLTVSAEQKNAANTLTAIKEIKEKWGLKTVLGVSNISFGLPNRALINHNFLQMALTAGLDLPIMNPGAPDMVRAVDVYKLINNIDKDAKVFIEKYSDEIAQKVTVTSEAKDNNLHESALEQAIRNGLKKECRQLVEEELSEKNPLDVISQVLIPILDRAGLDFEKGKIFIPQLILCATTAQEAFDVVKSRLNKEDSKGQGKIVIATVKGDIHDIGKNIVKVILENYGYHIIDLGKDVEPEVILKAVKDEDIKLLGLSALMTTTLSSMKETIDLVKGEKPDCKIMVGGAVLTEDYAKEIGADFYVKDAKESADRAKECFN